MLLDKTLEMMASELAFDLNRENDRLHLERVVQGILDVGELQIAPPAGQDAKDARIAELEAALYAVQRKIYSTVGTMVRLDRLLKGGDGGEAAEGV